MLISKTTFVFDYTPKMFIAKYSQLLQRIAKYIKTTYEKIHYNHDDQMFVNFLKPTLNYQ